MNIYDFDETIYNGDSSVDFFKYCLKRKPKCLLALPRISVFVLLYFFRIVKKEKMKSSIFSIIKNFDNIDEVVLDFWKSKDYKLKDFYMKQKKSTDIIISASPEFLLRPVSKKYKFKLIASKVNTKTGEFIGKNCHDKEKVRRLKEEMNIDKCEEFYSDSLSDTPLSEIAKRAFIVKGNKIIKWEEYIK